MYQQDFMDNNGDTYVLFLDECPHCGSEAEVASIGNHHTKSRKVNVRCSSRSCGNKGFTVGAIKHGLDFCVEHAVKKWNARKKQLPFN